MVRALLEFNLTLNNNLKRTIMKKILLTTAAVAAISTSAFADMMENQFYLTGAVSGAMFSKFKTEALGQNAKIKPKFGFGIDAGVGYYVMDNVRVELIYNRPFITSMKGSIADDAALSTAIGGTSALNAKSYSNKTVKHKPTINALFARVSGDVVDLGMGKIFLTGGLGWAQVKNSVTVSATKNKVTLAPTAGAAGTVATTKPSDTEKQKAKNNLAWTLGAGAAFDVAEGVHLDVAYSYRAYGKAKSSKDSVYKANSFNSHNLSAGVRFDI